MTLQLEQFSPRPFIEMEQAVAGGPAASLGQASWIKIESSAVAKVIRFMGMPEKDNVDSAAELVSGAGQSRRLSPRAVHQADFDIADHDDPAGRESSTYRGGIAVPADSGQRRSFFEEIDHVRPDEIAEVNNKILPINSIDEFNREVIS